IARFSLVIAPSSAGVLLLTSSVGATERDPSLSNNTAMASTQVKAAQPTNQAPTVSITEPANASTFNAGDAVTIRVVAADADGTVQLVEFFREAQKLGEVHSIPYEFIWSAVPSGSYQLT